MTEEIIIDGVDVAGCEYYYRCDCKINDDTDINLCKWHNDCYYKQLKRLQEKYDTLTNKFFNSETDKTRLEQENKELRREIVELRKDCNHCNFYKYRSALEEIKEDMEQDTTCESRECGCDDYAKCLNCIKETILNKINEVLNDK